MTKLVTDVLSTEYNPETTKIILVKAGLTHQLRQELKLPKMRELNDYHHAIDAFLAVWIGTYLLKHYPKLERFFVYGQHKVAPKLDLHRFNFIHDLVVDMVDKSKSTARQTGKNPWNLEDGVAYIKHLMGLKHLLVTHEVIENRGALFNQTIYKAITDKQNPETAKHKHDDLIPTKKNRDTTIYGGYSGQTTAHLAIVRINSKQPSYKVVGIRTRVLERLRQLQHESGLTLDEATKQVLTPKFTNAKGKVKDFDVLLPKIYLRQRIADVIDGRMHQFGLNTDTYYRNFQQLVLPLGLQTELQFPQESLKKETLLHIFDEICAQVEGYFALYSKMNKFTDTLVNSRKAFSELPIQDFVDAKGKTQPGMKSTLTDIMMGLHSNMTVRPLKQLGFKTSLGKLQVKSGITLTDQAQVVYESPTGLFKRYVKLADL